MKTEQRGVRNALVLALCLLVLKQTLTISPVWPGTLCVD